ncbi:exodeoxyribonuclease V subunit gamma, partial [Pseudomonas syringae pv. actinidiae ICMP 18804]
WKLAGEADPDSKLDDGERLLKALTVHHPLQPFSAHYFHAGTGYFSFAREWRDFLRNPVKHFFSQRLKIYFEVAEAPLADEEPFVLDALERYGLS